MTPLRERLMAVRARIADACARSGRDPSSVMLVAVSKVHPAAAIREAYAAGQRAFGENYVQELIHKSAQLRDCPELQWHYIGHLQRNKAKFVARVGAFVETVDSERVAVELDKHAAREGRHLPVMIQVNVAGEQRKSGCDVRELSRLVDHVRSCEHLSLRGLMTIPPLEDEAEASRPYFARLRELASRHELTGLSMGMSSDFEVAIEEGATIVRVGAAIFGPRPATRDQSP